jgi:hypothetical protein
MPSWGFETAIPAIERPQTKELDGTVTVICRETIQCYNKIKDKT